MKSGKSTDMSDCGDEWTADLGLWRVVLLCTRWASAILWGDTLLLPKVLDQLLDLFLDDIDLTFVLFEVNLLPDVRARFTTDPKREAKLSWMLFILECLFSFMLFDLLGAHATPAFGR